MCLWLFRRAFGPVVATAFTPWRAARRQPAVAESSSMSAGESLSPISIGERRLAAARAEPPGEAQTPQRPEKQGPLPANKAAPP